jgi:hypothetical protein
MAALSWNPMCRTACVYFDSPRGRFGHVTGSVVELSRVADSAYEKWQAEPLGTGTAGN